MPTGSRSVKVDVGRRTRTGKHGHMEAGPTHGQHLRARRLRDDVGATMAEYVLAVMLIALVGMVGAGLLGDAVLFKFAEAVGLWPS